MNGDQCFNGDPYLRMNWYLSALKMSVSLLISV